VCRAHLLASGLHRGPDPVRKGDAPLSAAFVARQFTTPQANRSTLACNISHHFDHTMPDISTKPYLLRAIYEWCTDSGYTPYLAVKVDAATTVPMAYVKKGE